MVVSDTPHYHLYQLVKYKPKNGEKAFDTIKISPNKAELWDEFQTLRGQSKDEYRFSTCYDVECLQNQ